MEVKFTSVILSNTDTDKCYEVLKIEINVSFLWLILDFLFSFSISSLTTQTFSVRFNAQLSLTGTLYLGGHTGLEAHTGQDCGLLAELWEG